MTNTDENKSVCIGWAHGSITPDGPIQLQGQMHERISESVHDPVTATALAIASPDGDEAILISCDLVSAKRKNLELIRQRVGEQLTDFNPRNLLINTTHTHTGPTLSEGIYPQAVEGVMSPTEYAAFFADCITELAVRAWKSRQPASISSALGHAVLGFNRRSVHADGRAFMYGRTDAEGFVAVEGGMDPGVELLFTWNEQDEMTGVVINVACPSQVVEQQLFISADFWHPVREEVRTRLGDNVHVYPMCSAAGDLSPRDLIRRNRGEPSMRAVEGMNELGRRLVRAVEDALHHSQTEKVRTPVFRHTTEDFSLPKRKVTEEEVEFAQGEMATIQKAGLDPSSKDGRIFRRHKQIVERFETQRDDPRYTADIHVIRLGDIAIATNPFELYLEYGHQIKACSKALQTFVLQLTNDSGAYLPTEKAVKGGGYSAMIGDNIVGPEGGALLVKRTVELINDLWPEEGA